jgi:hypothetical protein
VNEFSDVGARSLVAGAYTFQAHYLPADRLNVAAVDSNRISIQIR